MWTSSDQPYQLTMLSADTQRMWQLRLCFKRQSRVRRVCCLIDAHAQQGMGDARGLAYHVIRQQ
eukprot:6897774-Prorocentrum_lima.AAC.1